MNHDEYVKIVESKLDPLALKYFRGHFPRFKWQLEIFQKLIDSQKVKSVIDVGTCFPFSAGLFSFENIPVEYGCIEKPWEGMNEYCKGDQINLNYLPERNAKYDLVVCTECLEHLPSNMYKALDWLFDHSNKYLLLSFPLGGKDARDYEKENLGDYNGSYSNHFREFTRATAEEFIKHINAHVVEEKEIFTSAYGASIWNVLMEKNE